MAPGPPAGRIHSGGLATGVIAAFILLAYLDILALVPAEPPLDLPGMWNLSLAITRQVMEQNRVRFLVACLAFGVVYAYSAAEAFWLVWRERRRPARDGQTGTR